MAPSRAIVPVIPGYPQVAFRAAPPPAPKTNTTAILAVVIGVMVLVLGFTAAAISFFVMSG